MTEAVLLVPGSWHGAWAFEALTGHLERAGVRVHAVDLPSNGGRSGLAEDATVVRAELDAIAEPTVVVGHSYGGIAVSEGAASSPYAAALVYLCAFMLPPGQSLLDARQHRLPPWIALDEADGTQLAQDAEEVLYGDCPPAVARAAAGRLVPQSVAAVATPQTAAAWQERPSTYVVCTQDRAIPPALQEAMAGRATRVRRLDASHSPFLSRPDEVARIVREATP